jgi:hypothetical protein
MNNTEWVTGPKDDFTKQEGLSEVFYKTKPNFLEVNTRISSWH